MKNFTRPVLENSDCSFAFDLGQDKLLYISPDIERIAGYGVSGFFQDERLLFSLFDPSGTGEFKKYISHLPDKQRINVAINVVTAASLTKNVDVRFDIDTTGGNRILYGIIKEVSKKAITVNRLKHGDKFGTLIESFTDYFFVLNRKWEFIEVNPAFERAFEKKREVLLGQVIWNELPNTLGTDFETIYRKAFKLQKPVEFTAYYTTLNKWFTSTIYPSKDELIVFGKDVSHEILAAEELVWIKTNLEALINTTEDLIWSIDRNKNYVYLNKSFCSAIEQFTDAKVHEGGHVFENYNYTDEFVADWTSFYNRSLSGENYIITYDFEIKKQGAGVSSFAISFNPIRNIKGEVTGVGCFGKNITQQLKAEKAMLAQNGKLKNIAALTSHEIRGPVASLLGLIHVLDRKNLSNPDNLEIIELIFEAGNEIDAVLKQIVDNAFTGYFPE